MVETLSVLVFNLCVCVCVCVFHRIQFPDPMSRYRSNQVIVTGTMESAFKAREQLLVSMPVAVAMKW